MTDRFKPEAVPVFTSATEKAWYKYDYIKAPDAIVFTGVPMVGDRVKCWGGDDATVTKHYLFIGLEFDDGSEPDTVLVDECSPVPDEARLPHKELTDILARVANGCIGVLSAEDEIHALLQQHMEESGGS